MRVTVDTGRCIGAGNCVDAAPDYFDQNDEDGTVSLLRPEVGSGDEAEVAEAAAACPVRAIVLDDAARG